ncbi:MAG: TolC family protein [Betaproteobacteria bacterium]|nr:TolC family protein [Betaproteobacteria bacterium]
MRYTPLIFVGLLLTQPVYAVSLRAALDQAWEKSPQAQTLEAKRAESDAQGVAANSLLPGAPAIILGHRNDQLSNNAGVREWEAGIALPLWLPGQRDARQRQAKAGRVSLEADILALRLRLAGELREAIWQVRQVEAQIRLDEARAQTAKKLAEDVAKRVRAGELAKTDLNLAQNEWRTAQAAVLQNRNRLLQAQQAYATLTGTSVLPDDSAESAQSKPLSDDHPLMEEARLAIEVAQAQVHVASQSRRDNPELELSTRRARGNLNDAYAGTVALALRLPLATDARNLPLTSAAQTALTRAQSEYTRTRLALEYNRQQAEQALQAADQLLDLARQQRAAAWENLDLIQKSFSLGESDLFTLLRARTAAFEAEQAHNQQEIAQALSRARVNQAQGVLP